MQRSHMTLLRALSLIACLAATGAPLHAQQRDVSGSRDFPGIGMGRRVNMDMPAAWAIVLQCQGELEGGFETGEFFIARRPGFRRRVEMDLPQIRT